MPLFLASQAVDPAQVAIFRPHQGKTVPEIAVAPRRSVRLKARSDSETTRHQRPRRRLRTLRRSRPARSAPNTPVQACLLASAPTEPPAGLCPAVQSRQRGIPHRAVFRSPACRLKAEERDHQAEAPAGCPRPSQPQSQACQLHRAKAFPSVRLRRDRPKPRPAVKQPDSTKRQALGQAPHTTHTDRLPQQSPKNRSRA